MFDLKQILWDWRFAIAIAIAFLLFYLLEKQKAHTAISLLMLQAKRMAKDAVLKSGEQQEEWVVSRAYQFLPLSYRLLISEARLRKIVKWLFEKGKDYLDDGKFNNS